MKLPIKIVLLGGLMQSMMSEFMMDDDTSFQSNIDIFNNNKEVEQGFINDNELGHRLRKIPEIDVFLPGISIR